MKYFILVIVIIMLIPISSCGDRSSQAENSKQSDKAIGEISGTVQNGLRYIQFSSKTEDSVTVFRGDYIVPVLQGKDTYSVEIPQLKIKKTYPVKAGDRNYIKMKQSGKFTINIGSQKGIIEVVEYNEPHYKSVTSKEANEIIKNIDPIVLDVRTPIEYGMGHLKNSKLIPIQMLQNRLSELENYKERDIVIYCATGNRSTVASKILIDNGFKKIYNIHDGISGWLRSRLPIVR